MFIIKEGVVKGSGKSYYAKNRSVGRDIARLRIKARFPALNLNLKSILSATSSYFPINNAAHKVARVVQTDRVEMLDYSAFSQEFTKYSEHNVCYHYNALDQATLTSYAYRNDLLESSSEYLLKTLEEGRHLFAVRAVNEMGQGVSALGEVYQLNLEKEEFTKVSSAESVPGLIENDDSPLFLLLEYFIIDSVYMETSPTEDDELLWIDTESCPQVCYGFENPSVDNYNSDVNLKRLAKRALYTDILNSYLGVTPDRVHDAELILRESEGDVLGLFASEKFDEVMKKAKTTMLRDYDFLYRRVVITRDYPDYNLHKLESDPGVYYNVDKDFPRSRKCIPALWQISLGSGVIIDSLNHMRYMRSDSNLPGTIPIELVEAIQNSQDAIRSLAYYAQRKNDAFNDMDIDNLMTGDVMVDKNSNDLIQEIFLSDRRSDRAYFIPPMIMDDEGCIRTSWKNTINQPVIALSYWFALDQEPQKLELNVHNMPAGSWVSSRIQYAQKITEIGLTFIRRFVKDKFKGGLTVES